MVVSDLHTKDQWQSLVSSKDEWKWMEVTALPPVLTQLATRSV